LCLVPAQGELFEQGRLADARLAQQDKGSGLGGGARVD